jgi:hypothetical protein
MIGVIDEDGVLVEKYRHRFREGHSMATKVEAPFPLVPVETEVLRHTYIVVIAPLESESCLTKSSSAASVARDLAPV